MDCEPFFISFNYVERKKRSKKKITPVEAGVEPNLRPFLIIILIDFFFNSDRRQEKKIFRRYRAGDDSRFAGNETVFGFDSKDAVAGSILGQ